MLIVVFTAFVVWTLVSAYRTASVHHKKSLAKAEPKALAGQALYDLEHDAVDWTGVPIVHTEEERCIRCNPELPQVVVLPKGATLYEVPAYRQPGADHSVAISPGGLVDDPQARAKEADLYYAQVEEEMAKRKEALSRKALAEQGKALAVLTASKQPGAWDSASLMLQSFTMEQYRAIRPLLFSPDEVRTLEWVETKDEPKPLAEHAWPRSYSAQMDDEVGH